MTPEFGKHPLRKRKDQLTAVAKKVKQEMVFGGEVKIDFYGNRNGGPAGLQAYLELNGIQYHLYQLSDPRGFETELRQLIQRIIEQRQNAKEEDTNTIAQAFLYTFRRWF